ncbi:FGGY-family carbohydrate kinase [Kocuria rhizophila]|nr:FGGY-family carbohydrate kinase [Kocuria rhizophila]
MTSRPRCSVDVLRAPAWAGAPARQASADERGECRCAGARAHHHGVLQMRARASVYALEGSIAVTGSLVQWVRTTPRHHPGTAKEMEPLARAVEDNGGAYLVHVLVRRTGAKRPWCAGGVDPLRAQGRVARAVLEATAYQSREVVEAMNKDSRQDLVELRVDGGMTANGLLVQVQADQLGVP